MFKLMNAYEKYLRTFEAWNIFSGNLFYKQGEINIIRVAKPR